MDLLAAAGWAVEFNTSMQDLPTEFTDRYGWIPRDAIELFRSVRSCVAPTQKAWLVASSELDGSSGAAFAWNQWELDSLEAAEGDVALKSAIVRYWDGCCPVFISVDGRYAYLGVRRSDGRIVGGEEAEYEEVEIFADSILEMLKLLLEPDAATRRYL